MKIVILLLSTIIVFGCSDNEESVPPDIPINQLLASPDTIIIDGKQIFLSTSMWRDFMPFCPSDGRALISIIYLTSIDTAHLLSNSISSDALWIIYNDHVWKSWLADIPIPAGEVKPNRIVKYALDGPKWGPHVYVDVIVRVFDLNGNTLLLRAPNQWIGRTD